MNTRRREQEKQQRAKRLEIARYYASRNINPFTVFRHDEAGTHFATAWRRRIWETGEWGWTIEERGEGDVPYSDRKCLTGTLAYQCILSDHWIVECEVTQANAPEWAGRP